MFLLPMQYYKRTKQIYFLANGRVTSYVPAICLAVEKYHNLPKYSVIFDDRQCQVFCKNFLFVHVVCWLLFDVRNLLSNNNSVRYLHRYMLGKEKRVSRQLESELNGNNLGDLGLHYGIQANTYNYWRAKQ